MTTMVCFRAGGIRYAIPVEATLAVRTAAGLVCLPGHRPDVIGVLPGEPSISVISPLDAVTEGGQVLVITTAAHQYGLLVDAVDEVCAFDDTSIQSAPTGQESDLIAGVAERVDGLVLIADPVALAARL